MIETCRIRPMEAQDLPLVLSWRNHPTVRSHMLTQHEISLKEHENWFEKAVLDTTRQLLIVEDNENPIAYVQFTNASKGTAADWGFYAQPGAPKGTGRKLGHTALNHAFNVLELHKVCGQALESNQASIAFHQRLGFTQEGSLREQHCINGKHHALICFGMLKQEWQPN